MSPKLTWFLLTFAVAYPLDQLSKRWIIESLYYGETLEIVPGLIDLTHVRNPGGAFSVLAGASSDWRMPFFLGAGALAVGLLLVFYRRLPPQARLSAKAIGMIMGGALGNLTDRVVHGEVIDWLDVHLGTYTWPTFNVADSCIVVGVGILILEAFVWGEDWGDDPGEDRDGDVRGGANADSKQHSV